MKKLETIIKSLETVNNDTLKNIVNNANINIEALTKRDKLAILIINEIAKAVDSATRLVVFDCNYKYSKNVQKKNYLVDYASVICSDDETKRAIQIYFKSNSKLDTAYFDFCTSCKKTCKENLLALATDEMKVTSNDKTTVFKHVTYENADKVIKQIIAIIKADSIVKKNDSKKTEVKRKANKKTEVETVIETVEQTA